MAKLTRSAFADLAEDLPFDPSPYHAPTAHSEVRKDPDDGSGEDGSSALRGELSTETGFRRFIEGGNAIVTFRSKRAGERMTFKFGRPKDDAPNSIGRAGRPKPIFVGVLSGPDNGSDYSFIGTIFPEAAFWTFKHSFKSRVSADAASYRFVVWLVESLNMNPANIFERAEVWHEGRCGRCGRRLTVPESIESGFGPECINHV